MTTVPQALALLFVLLGVALGTAAGVVLLSYSQDRRRLRGIALEVCGGAPKDGRAVAVLNHWIYANRGFAKNRHRFVHRKLGPTPVQVLEHGGDCADKSRLLIAMLQTVRVPSTAVMLYDTAGGVATHTVVEARVAGARIAADPVFDIVFPDGRGGFFGIRDLRALPARLPQRLDELVAERGAADKVSHYKRETESYRWPRTINWEKNGVLRALARGLRLFVDEPALLPRPRILEDPKLLVGAVLTGAALATLTLAIVLWRW